MRKSLKSCAILLLACMLLTGLAPMAGAEDGLTPDERLHQKYDEPVTITTVLGYKESENSSTPSDVTPENATAVLGFKEDLNINLEYNWIVNNDQFSAKFGAELASGDLPDVMWLSTNQFEDLYSQGGLYDLTELYEQYANDAFERVFNPEGTGLGAATRDGRLYGLPSLSFRLNGTSQIYYNMDTLKEVGVESYEDLPTTIAEFEALCDKLMEKSDGAHILPANKLYFDQGLADFSPIFHAYGSWMDGWIDVGDGVIDYSGVQPNVKKAVAKLNEWYDKGYFAKDFVAQDVWAASVPVVEEIIAGEYDIVFGSWWVANWPLNLNKANVPEADWVVGPALTEDGGQTSMMIPRYKVNNIIAISKDCKNPEAIFKMMNWTMEYEEMLNTPEYLENETEEQKLRRDSHVYIWLPYRTFDSTVSPTNFAYITELREAGITTREEIDMSQAPVNNEIQGWINNYLDYNAQKDIDDPVKWGNTWGFYTSRMAPNGGVGRMIGDFETANVVYNELFVTTPTMITKKGQLDNYRDSTILSMIMGETPIDDFDKYVAEWRNAGGDEILAEVNEWFQGQ